MAKKNTIEVLNKEIKQQILTIAPKCDDNIIINGETIHQNTNIKDKKDVDEEVDYKERFEEIMKLYKSNKKESKKLISKLLNKEKEKFIIYLLDLD